MKKNINKILLLFLIIITILIGNVFAEDGNTTNNEEVENNIVETDQTKTQENVKAKVTQAGEVTERTTGSITEKVQNVTVKILDGERKNENFEATYVLSHDVDNKILAYELKEGNTVFVQITEGEDKNNPEVVIQDVVRQNALLYLLIFFFASILLVGRKKGLKAILGLLITVFAIYFIMILSIYKGYNAILLSIVTSFVIIILTFAILDGWNKKTVSAALGTLGGVILAGIIAFIVGYFAKLSGAQEEAIMLSISAKDKIFNFRDLLFAGIVVSALGACMDIGMSIASSLAEIKLKKPDMSAKELFKSGMQIGSDMIGTMTNTLILSFIGSSLTLVLLYMSSNISFVDMINVESIATEVVSALAGSVGIVYTVPITAAIFAFVNRDKEVYKTKSENLVEGKRSLKL